MEFKLIIKKINNTLSEKEKEEFETWYSESKEHQEYFHKVKNNKEFSDYILEKEKKWNSIVQRTTKNHHKNNNKKYFAVVASIALFFSVFYFFNMSGKKVPVKEAVVKYDNLKKVTLTLNNGENISLEDNTNIEVLNVKNKNKTLEYYKVEDALKEKEKENLTEIAYNFLTTSRGGEYSLVLEDGTKVWLNSESKLKYPVNFIDGKTRVVELIYGEAYFEVSSSKKHSGDGFKVVHALQEVNVLGTHFNIKAYPEDREIITTLKEGRVLIENIDGKKTYLKPNEQFIYNKLDASAILKKVNADEQISWVRGFFTFKNTSLFEIAKVLSRWYDVDINIKDEKIKNLKFNGVLNKKQNLDLILKSITNTSNINYEKNNGSLDFKK
ncbi:FecR family protein [Polaribacter batillariae]|uniref:FecR family protein n=1 Tax=Polaribacter batillariae TaxID=2808900 RepID=A0ABX7SXL8_9FLAO|nr:FecR family protein [Polaribacter batillariae]QTD38622.1 FecR family protein [Polaribacter batillariae]